MKRNRIRILCLCLTMVFVLMSFAGCGKESSGETVTLYAWGGDERTNSWIDDELAPYVLETT